jgi:chromosome partitioning protein
MKIDEDASVQVIDTPGALQPGLKDWINDADYVIIPTLMSTSDFQPLENTLEVYNKCEKKPPLLVVFNRWDRTNNTKEYIEAFEEIHPEINTVVVSETVAFKDASKRGLSIEQYKPRCKAAQQMREIYSLVKHELKIKEGYR